MLFIACRLLGLVKINFNKQTALSSNVEQTKAREGERANKKKTNTQEQHSAQISIFVGFYRFEVVHFWITTDSFTRCA